MWHWGRGPRVLLAHGWGSHAGRLTPFIPRLVRAGFGVSAFDAPGHGESRGRFASLPEFVDALMLVARSVAPVAFLGHSLGAAACGGGSSPSGPGPMPSTGGTHSVTVVAFYDENASGVLDASEAVRVPNVEVTIGGRGS